MKLTSVAVWLLLAFAVATPVADAGDVVNIGSRLELLVDDYLVDNLRGAELRLHKPTPREVAIVNDSPPEGNQCAYYTVFQDDDRYRMYYRGSHNDRNPGSTLPWHSYCLCYAESPDGIHWTRPDLNLVTFQGSKHNNIIFVESQRSHRLDPTAQAVDGPGMFNFTLFKDLNPNCKPGEKYKALGTGPLHGLYASKSVDGIHWSSLSDKPVINQGNFDSQNLAFWDSLRQQYVAFHRDYRCKVCKQTLRRHVAPSGVVEDVFRCSCREIELKDLTNDNFWRDIRTKTSKDFLNWSDHGLLKCPGAPYEHLYTNAIAPYYRAPHIFLGFPMRFLPSRKSKDGLPDGVSDGLFMTSRDGRIFKRWGEAIIRPGVQKQRWVGRNNMIAWGLLKTKSSIPGTPDELSLFSSEGYKRGDSCQLRRYTYRIDGFVSVHAPLSGGELVTRPLLFEGRELVINYSTSAAGSLRVEIQNDAGQPFEGYALAESTELYGDEIERVVGWKTGSDVGKLARQPVRLRFVMKDADLFSLRFRGKDQSQSSTGR